MRRAENAPLCTELRVQDPQKDIGGFVYVREAEELLDEARAIVSDSVERCLDKNITDWSKIKNIIKDDLSEYLWKKMKRNPVILPIIMEAQV